VLGVAIFNTQKQQFDFKPGPVFAKHRLGRRDQPYDPRTQSALLEAMSEEQVFGRKRDPPALERPVYGRRDAEPVRIRGHLLSAENQLDRFLLPCRGGLTPTARPNTGS
jgi:MoxR-like ATPase